MVYIHTMFKVSVSIILYLSTKEFAATAILHELKKFIVAWI